MDINTRLQITIGFVLSNPSSTEQDLIGHLVSSGDNEGDAAAAVSAYLQMLYQFGYISAPAYESMRNWGNAVSPAAISTATNTMLAAYNKQKTAASVIAGLREREAQLIAEHDAKKETYRRVEEKMLLTYDADIKDALVRYHAELAQELMDNGNERNIITSELSTWLQS